MKNAGTIVVVIIAAAVAWGLLNQVTTSVMARNGGHLQPWMPAVNLALVVGVVVVLARLLRKRAE